MFETIINHIVEAFSFYGTDLGQIIMYGLIGAFILGFLAGVFLLLPQIEKLVDEVLMAEREVNRLTISEAIFGLALNYYRDLVASMEPKQPRDKSGKFVKTEPAKEPAKDVKKRGQHVDIQA